jgi:hypothetical protein
MGTYEININPVLETRGIKEKDNLENVGAG